MAKCVTAAALAFALVLAAPVAGKSGMVATLLGEPNLDVKPGTQIRVAWRVSTTGAEAARGGDDDRFYVRLLSATGARSTHAYGRVRHRTFVAMVRIPRGGAGDIEIRLKGWQIGPGGSRRADAQIPIANDPFPG
jgi:hypothetical protein